MSFFMSNRFEGSEYVWAKSGSALVFDTPCSSAAATEVIREHIDECAAVIVGAGAGLSTAAGLTYTGSRFDENFADFRNRFGITDMYSGGFYPFPDVETYWAWWSRHIMINRYRVESGLPYLNLLDLLNGKDYFVITTNVDHQFQLSGFDKNRLFYTQGDYGLFQCSRNCSNVTYDNKETIYAMVDQQRNLRIPSDLVPTCPNCGSPLIPNLRIDGLFCEDSGWHSAAERYESFCKKCQKDRVLYLELGVGDNTPVIIKYPFWAAVKRNNKSVYTCVNRGQAYAPATIASRSILVDTDINAVLRK